MQGVILAAGKGSRLHPITLRRSKAMVPVLGKPMLLRVVETLLASPSIRHVILCLDQALKDHGLGPDLEALIADGTIEIASAPAIPTAPGQLSSHYAPSCPVRMNTPRFARARCCLHSAPTCRRMPARPSISAQPEIS